MTKTKAQAAATAVACTLVLAVASAAWACTPGNPQSFSTRPQSGLPGASVTVAGTGFKEAGSTPESGVVEIRWNSTTGPLLATATGPNFSVSITIPDVAPRTYTILGIQRDDKGETVISAPTAFTVTRAQASSPPPVPPSETAANEPAPAAESSEPAAAESADPPPAAAASGTPRSTAARPRAAAPAASPTATEVVAPAAVASKPAPEVAAEPAPEVAAEPVPAVPDPATAEFGPSAGVSSGDLWSGFGATGSVQGPSLIGDPAAAGSHRDLRLATALMAVGTATLLGTFSALGLRRRRSTSAGSSS